MIDETSQDSSRTRGERSLARQAVSMDISGHKQVLILTADVGLGHRITAQVIATALKELYGDSVAVDVVNPMNDARTPEFLREGQADYDRAVREMPDLYQLGYQVSDVPLAVAVMETGLAVMMADIMRDVLRQYEPDVIVATHQHYLAPLRAVFDADNCHLPLFTVVTDLATVHQMWFNDVTELCLVPTDVVRDQAIKHGLPPEKVRVTGIPVAPEMAKENRVRAAIRDDIGWRRDLKTVLVVGGKRVANLSDALRVLNHSGLPLQLAVVAGGDDELFDQLQRTDWHVPARLYNFVGNMSMLMHASDCVMCKAGGLIVTEALACGLPLLLFGVIPGQETGNANYVTQNGAGELAESPIEVLDIMSHWLQNDGELLTKRAERARALGRPFAAYDVAESVWAAAHRGPYRRRIGILRGLGDLNGWMARLDALWRREFGVKRTPHTSHHLSEGNS